MDSSGPVVVPDGGWGWIIVLSSFMCNVLVDGIGLAYGVLLPRFADYFNAPRSKVSLVGSLLIGTYFCTGPVAGGLVNKFGCRMVTIVGSVVSALGVIIASFSSDLDVLIITYGLIGGIGFGLIYLPSIVVVGFYFDKKRPVASGIAVCGSGIGAFMFAPVLEFLLDIYDWRGVLLIMSGFILNAAVCGMLMRPLKRKYESTKNQNCESTSTPAKMKKDDINAIHSEEMKPFIQNNGTIVTNKDVVLTNIRQSRSVNDIVKFCQYSVNLNSGQKLTNYNENGVSDRRFESLPEMKYTDLKLQSEGTQNHVTTGSKMCRNLVHSLSDIILEIFDISLLLNPSFVLICIGNIFNTAAKYIPFMYLVDRVILLGISSKDAAFLLSIIGITNTIGRFLSAMIANIKGVNALVVLITALLVSAATVFLLPLCTVYPVLIVFSVIFGLSVGSSSTALTSLVLCDLLGVEKLAKSFGLLCFARGIACVIGPWFAGFVFQVTGNYDVSFYLSGGMFAIGAFMRCLVLLPRVKRCSVLVTQKEIELLQ